MVEIYLIGSIASCIMFTITSYIDYRLKSKYETRTFLTTIRNEFFLRKTVSIFLAIIIFLISWLGVVISILGAFNVISESRKRNNSTSYKSPFE